MKRLFVQALLCGLTLSLLAGCNQEESENISNFTILRSFSLRDKDSRMVQLKQNQDMGYYWSVVLGTDNSGRHGIALVNSQTQQVIPFGVDQNFYLGSNSTLSAATTGQGVSLRQTTVSESDGSRAPYTFTENCDNVRTERICDSFPGRADQCHDRTITSSGTRQVEVTTSGSIYEVQVKLLDSKNNVLAKFSYSKDATRESRNAGSCQ